MLQVKTEMKKFTLILIVFGLIGFSAQGQYDPKARTILDAMSSKYAKIGVYKAQIKYSMVNEVDGLNESMSGEITVKNDMFRLKIDDQIIYNDGTTVWTFIEEFNEVNINNYDPDEEGITPSKIYTAYKSGYKYVHLGEEVVNGVRCDVIDLVAENAKDSQFFKIRLKISQKDRSLLNWTMFEKSGTQYIYFIDKFQSGINVSDTFFKFDASKHPGVEIVDLR